MTIVTNEHGQNDMFAKEPTMYITEKDLMDHEEMTYAERAELANSRLSMLGMGFAFLSYALTGKLFFGLY
jgi:hypothetical protein